MVDNFEQIRKLLKFEDKDDFYFLQIIQRKKDGCDVPSANNGYRTIKTYYIRSLEDFDRRKDAIVQLCDQNKARAYINLNVRSAREVALTAAKAYIDLVREDRCEQGHRVYDHVCGTTPKAKNKKRWIVDVDDLSNQQVDKIIDVINHCRSKKKVVDMRFLEKLTEDLYDNFISKIPTVHGVHLITCGFDLNQFKDKMNECRQELGLNTLQVTEICNVKKDNPTLIYFNNGESEIRERYKRLSAGEWFKKHYDGKSLGEVIEFEA